MLAEKYILLDFFLFKISSMCNQYDCFISFEFSCRTSGVIKTYLTISDYLRSYIKSCHICQLNRNEKPPSRQLQTRITLNYRPLSRLSMHLKVMSKLSKGHKFILCIIDEVTNLCASLRQ